MTRKARLAWLSVLGAKDSCSAYITKTLLPSLAQNFDVTLFTERAFYGTIDYRELGRLDKEQSFDLYFYNVENTQGASFVREQLAKRPGFVYFHDVYFQEKPLAKDEFEAAQCLLFSSSRDVEHFVSYSEQNELAPKPMCYLPYPISLPPKAPVLSNNNENVLKIACCAELGVEYRAEKLIAALSTIEREVFVYWMLPQEKIDHATAICHKFGFPHVKFFPSPSPELWTEISSNADLIFQVKVSALMDVGHWLVLSLASGKPVIVSDFADTGLLPDSAVLKVLPGYHEVENYQKIFSEFNDTYRSYAKNAREFIKEFHEVSSISSQLKNIINKDYLIKNVG